MDFSIHSTLEKSAAVIQAVWEKGAVAPGNDANVYRKDECGAWVCRNQYGDRNAKYGWEIDHIRPVSEGGSDVLSNLRPLFWRNNAERQDGRLTCPFTALGTENVRRTR